MFLDLHELIEVPGRSAEFACELDQERLAFPALLRFLSPVKASGLVKNEAGMLLLEGSIETDMLLCCDLCAAEFEQHMALPVRATLQADAPDDDEDDTLFPLEGDGIDVSSVMETSFILQTDMRFLCRPDCRGLCPSCGKNLNDGPCDCAEEVDPRLAVLGQLLDDTQKKEEQSEV